MDDYIFKNNLIQYLQDKHGWEDVRVLHIQEQQGGYLSMVRVVDLQHRGGTTTLFVKQQKKDAWGAERITDALASYAASDRAAHEAHAVPRVLGSFVQLNHGPVPLHEITEGSLVQVQEYIPGTNLYSLCYPTISTIIEQNAELIGMRVATVLAKIHSHKHPLARETLYDEYSRSLRDVLAHPELTLNLFQNFLHESSIFTGAFRSEYIREMFNVIDHFSQFKERNTLIHADYWHTNILLEGGMVHVVDYSRMHHGEPGIDVGHFYAVCLCLAVLHHNDVFVRMANAFLKAYTDYTKDTFIQECAVTYMGFNGAVCAVESFYPNFSPTDRRNFVEFIYSCLRAKRIRVVHAWQEVCAW